MNSMKDIGEEQDETEIMSHTFNTCLSLKDECDEDKLLGHESLFEKKEVLHPRVSFTASPPHSDKIEEDEVEAALEYLRRWMKEQ